MDKIHFSDDFVKKYSPLVYTAIYRRLKGCGFSLPREEILDIQQDVFTSIFEDNKLANIHNSESIPYWIAIVSGNAAMQHMRMRHRTEPEKCLSLSDKIDGIELEGLIPSTALNPSEDIDRAERSMRINDAIEALPVKEKLVLKLNMLHDKKHEEIADMLNMPMGTVSSYIKRAKEKLKVSLMDFE